MSKWPTKNRRSKDSNVVYLDSYLKNYKYPKFDRAALDKYKKNYPILVRIKNWGDSGRMHKFIGTFDGVSIY